MAGETIVAIDSERKAWSVLRELLEGKLDPSEITLDFSAAQWATLHINYRGLSFDQSLTPSAMRGLIELQNALYRSIALVAYGDARITRLTDEDKRRFELVFKVNKGSSDVLSRAEDLLKEFGGKVAEKMNSKDIMICVLVIAVLFFGLQGFNSYLAHNLQTTEISSQEQREQRLMDIIQQFSSGASTEQEVLDKAIEQVPAVETIKEDADGAYEEIIKQTEGVDEISIQGVQLGSSTLAQMNQVTRRKAEKVTVKGLFTVSAVDATRNPGGFVVKFDEVGGSREITADLTDAMVADKLRKVVERATFSKKPVRVTITARKLGDSYLDAKVIKAVSPRKLP